jgi:hypothetical protein
MGTRVLVALSLAVATMAAGCTTSRSNSDSAGDFQGAQAQVANTVEDLQSSAAKGDEGELCGRLLAASLVDRLSSRGPDCSTTVHDALENTDSADLTVESVRITGTTATARVKADTGDRDRVVTIGLVRERGRWKIARLPS